MVRKPRNSKSLWIFHASVFGCLHSSKNTPEGMPNVYSNASIYMCNSAKLKFLFWILNISVHEKFRHRLVTDQQANTVPWISTKCQIYSCHNLFCYSKLLSLILTVYRVETYLTLLFELRNIRSATLVTWSETSYPLWVIYTILVLFIEI